jgi:hypothetical protein
MGDLWLFVTKCSAVITHPIYRKLTWTKTAAGASSRISHQRSPQAMVSMMLPSALVELLEELEFELPRSAIELSMNDEIID